MAFGVQFSGKDLAALFVIKDEEGFVRLWLNQPDLLITGN
jgi:hypothetical protein